MVRFHPFALGSINCRGSRHDCRSCVGRLGVFDSLCSHNVQFIKTKTGQKEGRFSSGIGIATSLENWVSVKADRGSGPQSSANTQVWPRG